MATKTASASSQLAQLVADYRAANPGASIDDAWSAIRRDPANGPLFNLYALENNLRGPAPASGTAPTQAGVAAVQRVSAGIPWTGEALSESANAAKALADARSAYMLDHNLEGAKGIREADRALHLINPRLFENYMRYCEQQHVS